MRYLFYFLDNFEHRPGIDCLVFDSSQYEVESDLNTFLAYTGPLQRVVFVEEYSIGRSTEPWYDRRLAEHKDLLWIANFGGGSNYDVYRKFKRILDMHGVNYERVHVLTNSAYEFEMLDKIFNDKAPNYIASHYCDLIGIREMLQSQKPKKFTFFSRNWGPFRLLAFIDLMRRGVTDDSYFSFFNIKNIYKDDYEPYYYYNLNEISNNLYQAIEGASDQSWATDLIDYWETKKFEIFRRMPYTLKGERDETGEREGWQVISNTFKNAYDNSYFSLIPETYMGSNTDVFQCTEKTIKSVLHRHPFMVYANKHHLKRMRTYGFKSFGDYIDESYDDLVHPVDKINAINAEAERIKNMNYLEFKKLMWDMSDITTHNYQVIMDRIKNPMSRTVQSKYSKDIDRLLLKEMPMAWYHKIYDANN